MAQTTGMASQARNLALAASEASGNTAPLAQARRAAMTVDATCSATTLIPAESPGTVSARPNC